MLISVDNASAFWVPFYKILKALSVLLELNYLAIVSSFYLCSFGKGRERLPENRLQGEDTKQSTKRGMSKGQKEEVTQRGKREVFVYRRKQ